MECPKCQKGFDSLQGLSMHWIRGHKESGLVLYMLLNNMESRPKCACGCGDDVPFVRVSKGFQKFIRGHNSKPSIAFDASIEKYCPKCKTVKPLGSFRKNGDGHQSYCIDCVQIYYNDNRSTILARSKLYYENNKESVIRKMINRARTDIDYRIKLNLRRYVGDVMRRNVIPAKKCKKTLDLLGCTIQEFKDHLASKFQKGMDWDNYGLYGWHIDHIMPCASFDLSDPEQQKECFHFTNLQPLWAEDNLKKGSKILT